MPELGKKKYPYTEAGMAQYKKDKAKKSATMQQKGKAKSLAEATSKMKKEKGAADRKAYASKRASIMKMQMKKVK